MHAPRATPTVYAEPDEIQRADTCAEFKAAAARGELEVHAVGHRSYAGRRLPARVLPEIPSAGWWDARRDQSWGEDWHRHEGVEFALLARGRLELGVDGSTYHMQPGDLMITRPWQSHRMGDPTLRASRFHWVLLDVGVRRPNEPWIWPDWLVLSGPDRERLTQLLRHNEHPIWRADEPVRDAFRHMAAALDCDRPHALESRLKIGVNLLLAAILDLLQTRRIPLRAELASTRRTVELFLDSLPGHAAHPWTLDDMARRCGLARTRFAQHCKEITNLAPAAYLARCRLAAAARLLRRAPERSVTDIALDCGFQSSQYFANRFRQQYGCTPSAYRGRAAGPEV